MKKTKMLEKHVFTIGIMGSCGGVGTTHLSIMLAGFISSKEHRKTALVELNHAGSFAALYDLYYNGRTAVSNVSEFNINGIDFYCGKTMDELIRIFQMGYDYIIMDLGSDWVKNQYELLRCDISCIVGSCTEWKIKKFANNIEYLHNMLCNGKIHFVKTFGSDSLKKELESNYHIKIKNVPFEVTPFLLHKESFTFFEEITG